jgi:hypothetical protein
MGPSGVQAVVMCTGGVNVLESVDVATGQLGWTAKLLTTIAQSGAPIAVSRDGTLVYADIAANPSSNRLFSVLPLHSGREQRSRHPEGIPTLHGFSLDIELKGCRGASESLWSGRPADTNDLFSMRHK